MTPEQITAARERCAKAEHLSLRTTQCCDVSIDGAIGSALEFIGHVRTDIPLALDRIAELERENERLKSGRGGKQYFIYRVTYHKAGQVDREHVDCGTSLEHARKSYREAYLDFPMVRAERYLRTDGKWEKFDIAESIEAPTK